MLRSDWVVDVNRIKSITIEGVEYQLNSTSQEDNISPGKCLDEYSQALDDFLELFTTVTEIQCGLGTKIGGCKNCKRDIEYCGMYMTVASIRKLIEQLKHKKERN